VKRLLIISASTDSFVESSSETNTAACITVRVREITIWTKNTISSTVEKVILVVAAECKPKFMVLVKIKTKESNISNLFVCLTLHYPPQKL
jgi:hypothetical protein